MTRRPGDFYPTPQVAVFELLEELAPHLMRGGLVVDPAAGRGNLLDAVEIQDPSYKRLGIEINPEHVQYVRKAHPCIEADYLADWAYFDSPTLIISNPPYSLAQEFVTKMLDDRGPYTTTAVLLRLGFLASQKRYEWWLKNGCSALRVLSHRPSFTGDGKTDNSDYGWFIFPPARSLKLLPIPAFGWYCAGQRKTARNEGTALSIGSK